MLTRLLTLSEDWVGLNIQRRFHLLVALIIIGVDISYILKLVYCDSLTVLTVKMSDAP